MIAVFIVFVLTLYSILAHVTIHLCRYRPTAERLRLSLLGPSSSPWGKVHTITVGTIGPHPSQKPPTVVAGAPAVFDLQDSGILHFGAIPHPSLLPLPLPPVPVQQGLLTLEDAGITTAVHAVAPLPSPLLTRPLPSHSSLLRLVASVASSDPLSSSPLPQLTRALSRLLADPMSVIATASWLAAAHVQRLTAVANSPAADLWLALTLHPSLAPLPLRTKLMEACAFGVRRAIGWVDDRRTAAQQARRAATGGGSTSGGSGGPGRRDPLAIDDMDADDDDDVSGDPYGDRRVTAAQHALAVPKQRAVVSRKTVLGSALTLLGPRAPVYASGNELLAVSSDGLTMTSAAVAAAASSPAADVSAAGSQPSSAFALSSSSSSSSSSSAGLLPPLLPSITLAPDQHYALASESRIGVQFSHEAGHGTGPTVEFFALACRELQRRDMRMWMDNTDGVSSGSLMAAATADTDEDGSSSSSGEEPSESSSRAAASSSVGGKQQQKRGASSSSSKESSSSSSPSSPVEAPDVSAYVTSPSGLHPLPMVPSVKLVGATQPSSSSSPGLFLAASSSQSSLLRYFDLAGRVAGKALSEGRLIDLPLSQAFIRAVLTCGNPAAWKKGGQGTSVGPAPVGIADVEAVSPSLGRSLRHLQALVERRDALVQQILSAEQPPSSACSALLSLSSEVQALCLDFTFPGLPGTPLTLTPHSAPSPSPLPSSSYSEPPKGQNGQREINEAVQLARACRSTTALPWYQSAASAASSSSSSSSSSIPPGQVRSLPLLPSGADTDVSLANLHVYVAGVCDSLCGSGTAAPAVAFHRGLSAYMPAGALSLSIFTPSEVRDLLCGGDAVADDTFWAPHAIAPHISVTHGYKPDSPQITSLLQTMSGLTVTQRRLFLRFVTGAPRLPVGGWAALSPRLTVVKAVPPTGISHDCLLPTCSTCQLYLKLPAYSDQATLKAKLLLAISEGQEAFSFD